MKFGKNYLIFIASIIFFAVIFYILSHAVEFVYVNPNVNTRVFSFISPVVEKIDKAVKSSVLSCNLDKQKIKILYQNAYGSGFLNHNPIPNDLDYSVGIHLGKYVYDGKNASEIAKDIDNKMSSFQINFYDYISNNKNQSFLTEFDTLGSIIHFERKSSTNSKFIEQSIPEIFKDKEYVVYLKKTFPDKPDFVLEYPFVLKPNEILIEDYAPIQIFAKGISYNKQMQDFLREITIVVDFYADIEDVKTKKIKTVEIVAESFTGQRLQLSRRFFPPITFVGENSASYLKNLDYLKDDDKYLEYRLFNFKRHLQEFSSLNEFKDRPVKMLKRILQCTEIISPALDEQTKNEIYRNVFENLNNSTVIILNDYSTALGNLIQITQKPKLYSKVLISGELQKLVESMRKNLNSLKSDNSHDIEELIKFQNYIEQSISIVRSNKDLIFFSQNLLAKMETYNKNILNLFNENIKNQKQMISYVNTFSKIYKDAGFHKIELYWIDKRTLGIVKDDFTKDIPQNELSNFAKRNGLARVNYKLILKSQAPKVSVRYENWSRYNPTREEEQNWQKLKRSLLNDKKKFKIKRKIILRYSNPIL